MLKTKLGLTALALGISGMLSAAAYVPEVPMGCTGLGVTVPCEKSAWDAGFEFFYMQPTSETNYIFARETSTANNTTDSRHHYIEPKWRWGFRIEGSYHFGTGNDVTLNWLRLRNTTDRGLVLLDNHSYVLPYTPGEHTAMTIRNRISFDAVNLEFGQDVDFGDDFNIRFHSGLQYVYMRNNIRSVGTGTVLPTNPPTALSTVAEYKSRFDGIGPRFGMDASYDISDSFSLIGSSAGSLLVGRVKSNNDIVSLENDVVASRTLYSGSHRAVVPGFEAKLGVRYTNRMNSGDLILDVAYNVMAYLNILQNNIIVPHNNNLAFHGPSVKIKWVGNI